MTFSLDGKAVVPEQPAPQLAKPIIDEKFEVDAEKAETGAGVYAENLCVGCHGAGAVAGMKAPDLRESPILLTGSEKAFESVVRGGALLVNGMPKFPDLTDAELESIRHFVRRQAHDGVKSGGGH